MRSAFEIIFAKHAYASQRKYNQELTMGWRATDARGGMEVIINLLYNKLCATIELEHLPSFYKSFQMT